MLFSLIGQGVGEVADVQALGHQPGAETLANKHVSWSLFLFGWLHFDSMI